MTLGQGGLSRSSRPRPSSAASSIETERRWLAQKCGEFVSTI